MKKACAVIPSLLSANFLNLQKDLDEIYSIGIKKLHYDVMDGHFVNNISFGEEIFKQIDSPKWDIDVHLMVSNPIKKTRDFIAYGAKKVSFHLEVINEDISKYKKEIIQLKKEFPDIKLGLAINPPSDIRLADKWIDLFDYFLIMSVVPGKGGQAFIEGSEKKIKYLDDYRKKNKKDFFIEVDGGINDSTGKLCLDNGVDYLVCGSFFFKAKDKADLIKKIIQ